MFLSDLELLMCPSCKGEVSLSRTVRCSEQDEILEGELGCQCGANYPIREGVPEFISTEQYAGSFGFEWAKWPRVQFDGENVGTPMEGATAARLLSVTGVRPSWFADKTIFEIGCGAGRFLDVAESYGAKVVGLELSEAVYVARRNLEGRNALIVRGDALHPPFRDRIFDMALAIGVLHHIPSPESAFLAMVTKVRPKGQVAVQVYNRYDSLLIKQTAFYRKVFRVLGRKALVAYSYFSAGILYHLCFLPIVGYGFRLLFPVKKFPTFQHRYLNIFDWLSPTYMSYHGTREVFEWFKSAGCSEIEPTDLGPSSFRGIVN